MRFSYLTLALFLLSLISPFIAAHDASSPTAAPAAASPSSSSPSPSSSSTLSCPACPACPSLSCPSPPELSCPAPEKVDLSPLLSSLSSLSSSSSSSNKEMGALLSGVKDILSQQEKDLKALRQEVHDLKAASSSSSSSASSAGALEEAVAPLLAQLKALQKQQEALSSSLSSSVFDRFSHLPSQAQAALLSYFHHVKAFLRSLLQRSVDAAPGLMEAAKAHFLLFVREAPVHARFFYFLAKEAYLEGCEWVAQEAAALVKAQGMEKSITRQQIMYAAMGAVGAVVLVTLIIVWKVIKSIVKFICCCGRGKKRGEGRGMSEKNKAMGREAIARAAPTSGVGPSSPSVPSSSFTSPQGKK